MKSAPIAEITDKTNMMIIRHGFTEANYQRALNRHFKRESEED